MSQSNSEGFDPLDPIGNWRAMRDANLDAWAKGMASMTNSDSFAKLIGMQMDTLLAASAPLRENVQKYTEAYLAQMNMPSRNEVTTLAQRMTNIELRLDDMQAQLDDILAALQALPASIGAGAAVEAPAEQPAPARTPARRSRKAAEEKENS